MGRCMDCKHPEPCPCSVAMEECLREKNKKSNRVLVFFDITDGKWYQPSRKELRTYIKELLEEE
jgi:hypothetical protein